MPETHLQPKTIEAYWSYRKLECRIDNLTSDQLLDYFNEPFPFMERGQARPYGLKFFYTKLHKTWDDIRPKTSGYPAIEQVDRLFAATNKLSYKVFFFTIYRPDESW